MILAYWSYLSMFPLEQISFNAGTEYIVHFDAQFHFTKQYLIRSKKLYINVTTLSLGMAQDLLKRKHV